MAETAELGTVRGGRLFTPRGSIHDPSAQNTRELETKERFPDMATGSGGGENCEKYSPLFKSDKLSGIKFIKHHISNNRQKTASNSSQ